MKRHQNNTKSFVELTNDEKSKSVNAQLLLVERVMALRISEAPAYGKNPNDLRTKYILRLNRIIINL